MLAESRNVVITCHTGPDGDAIGSSLAMYEYLKRKGKQVVVIVPNYFPDYLRWMNDADKIIQYDRRRALSKSYFQQADLVIALDYNGMYRVDEMQLPLSHCRCKKLMIDHHENPENFCTIQLSRPEMSSTCELLYRLLIAMGEEKQISLHCAEDLYAGMCTDTGRFTYNSNDPEIYEIIAGLMRKGIDKDKIVRNIYNQYSEGRYRLLGHILLNKLELYPDLHASIFSVSREELKQFKYMKGDAEGFVNIPLEIKGTKLSISLREDTEKDRIFVSIRSYDDFSAQEVAEKYFNGGGHFHAAGGTLYCTIDEALDTARKALEAYRETLSQ
ncbi:MAG: DHH family phosphoesterase [Bacteroidaceae bacterium]|nr:DHH family phosphoesterase [Bacteroidaceae bacterium]